MSAHLTFVATPATAGEVAAATGAIPVLSGLDVQDGLKAMGEGRDVVALMRAMATGLRLPEGSTISFHEECPTDGPRRAQCEARVWRPRVHVPDEVDASPSP